MPLLQKGILFTEAESILGGNLYFPLLFCRCWTHEAQNNLMLIIYVPMTIMLVVSLMKKYLCKLRRQHMLQIFKMGAQNCVTYFIELTGSKEAEIVDHNSTAGLL